MLQSRQVESQSKVHDTGSGYQNNISKNNTAPSAQESLSFFKFIFSGGLEKNELDDKKSENIDEIGDSNIGSPFNIDKNKAGIDETSEFMSMFTQKLDSLKVDNTTQFQFVINFPKWGSVAVKVREYPAYWHFSFKPHNTVMRQKLLGSEEKIRLGLKQELGKEIEIDVE